MKRSGFLLGPIALTAAAVIACNNDVTGLEPPSDPATETFAPALGVDIPSMSRTADGVYFAEVAVGTGPEVIATTDSVFVTYSGYLKDGSLFDSGTNVKFTLANVIPGFKSGLFGMKEGGRRKLVIPSALGYGSQSQRDPATGKITIPRQSTLVFDVHLLRVHNPPDTTSTT